MAVRAGERTTGLGVSRTHSGLRYRWSRVRIDLQGLGFEGRVQGRQGRFGVDFAQFGIKIGKPHGGGGGGGRRT